LAPDVSGVAQSLRNRLNLLNIALIFAGTRRALPLFMNTTTKATSEACQSVGFLEDRYELGELLGAGAMGRVFAARDVVLGIDVAVKMMHPELVSSSRQVTQFTAEATLSARMLSPNIVKVLGLAVSQDGVPCIIFEKLEGETVGQRIARDGGISLAETVEIIKQTSRALARAHRLGILHRDVKPDNIFLTQDSRGRTLVKLLDFGIAAAIDTQGTYAAPKMLAGTPEYMAPEVLLGTHEVDARADLYGLGVVAFECLTGQCPFPGDVARVVEQLKSGDRASFTEHRPDLDGVIDAWMDRALQADPYWRFASAKELGDAFELAASSSSRAPAAALQAAA
jgi:serine/threonine-protein kinase